MEDHSNMDTDSDGEKVAKLSLVQELHPELFFEQTTPRQMFRVHVKREVYDYPEKSVGILGQDLLVKLKERLTDQKKEFDRTGKKPLQAKLLYTTAGKVVKTANGDKIEMIEQQPSISKIKDQVVRDVKAGKHDIYRYDDVEDKYTLGDKSEWSRTPITPFNYGVLLNYGSRGGLSVIGQHLSVACNIGDYPITEDPRENESLFSKLETVVNGKADLEKKFKVYSFDMCYVMVARMLLARYSITRRGGGVWFTPTDDYDDLIVDAALMLVEPMIARNLYDIIELHNGRPCLNDKTASTAALVYAWLMENVIFTTEMRYNFKIAQNYLLNDIRIAVSDESIEEQMFRVRSSEKALESIQREPENLSLGTVHPLGHIDLTGTIARVGNAVEVIERMMHSSSRKELLWIDSKIGPNVFGCLHNLMEMNHLQNTEFKQTTRRLIGTVHVDVVKKYRGAVVFIGKEMLYKYCETLDTLKAFCEKLEAKFKTFSLVLEMEKPSDTWFKFGECFNGWKYNTVIDYSMDSANCAYICIYHIKGSSLGINELSFKTMSCFIATYNTRWLCGIRHEPRLTNLVGHLYKYKYFHALYMERELEKAEKEAPPLVQNSPGGMAHLDVLNKRNAKMIWLAKRYNVTCVSGFLVDKSYFSET